MANALKALGYEPAAADGDGRRAAGHDFVAAGLSVRAGAHLVRHVARRPAARRCSRACIRKFQTPHVSTWIAGFVVGIPAGIWDIGTFADLTNIGTLFAFIVVSAGVIVLRRKQPDTPRGFRVPWVPLSAAALDRLLPGADAEPAARNLGPLLRLAGDRPGDLLHLRQTAQHAARRAGAYAVRINASSIKVTRKDGCYTTELMSPRKLAALAVLCIEPILAQSVTPSDLFESKIRPVFASQCFACHNAKMKTAGLDLSSSAGLQQGATSGPVISKDDPQKSRLLEVLRYQGATKMPPMGKLPDAQIADIAAWVKLGAPWPETAATTVEPKKSGKYEFTAEQHAFWAFQPVKDYAPPAVKNAAWPQSPVDNFILAKLEEKGITARAAGRQADAAAARDLRSDRPAAHAEGDRRFLSDRSPDAFAKVVDRLLASPRYGERWGRHWLDVARYADSTGADEDIRYPYAWRYRDYVIDAFNRDLPYDQFVMEQIAGDLLPAEKSGEVNQRGIVATGFLAIGPKLLAEQDKPKMVYDMVDEQLDTTTRAFMGLTVACARCHDHKFDPIPTRDYYSLASIFASTKSLSKVEGTVSQIYFAPLVPKDVYERYEQHQDRIKDKDREIEQVITAEATTFAERLAPHLAEYMTAALDYEHRPRDQEDVCIGEFAAGRHLDGVVLERWINYLRPTDDVRPHLDRWAQAVKLGAPAVREAAELTKRTSSKRSPQWKVKVDEWGRKVAEAAAHGKSIPEKPEFEGRQEPFLRGGGSRTARAVHASQKPPKMSCSSQASRARLTRSARCPRRAEEDLAARAGDGVRRCRRRERRAARSRFAEHRRIQAMPCPSSSCRSSPASSRRRLRMAADAWNWRSGWPIRTIRSPRASW